MHEYSFEGMYFIALTSSNVPNAVVGAYLEV